MAAALPQTAQISAMDTTIITTSGGSSAGTGLNPVPMSFPAILRNAKISNRFAHLLSSESPSSISAAPAAAARKTRDDREGKRWLRRKENARFTGNPHIVQASKRDLDVELPFARRTFPEPLPRYLPRTTSAPSTQLPILSSSTANSGRYSLSLKGMRRNLRQHGFRAQVLVRDIEREILDWLVGGIILMPGATNDDFQISGRAIGDSESIIELSRNPLQMVWAIENDAFARYITHCCARYHKVVSYSKDSGGRRLTYLLRPNVTRPDFAARAALDTPPATESDYSLGVLSESDILSVEENEPISDAISDTETRPVPLARHRRLSSVSEHSDGLESDTNNITPRPLRTDYTSHHVQENSGADADDDRSVIGDDLAQSIDSLDLNPPPREPPLRYTASPAERTPLRDRRGFSRTSSSPSRSPRPTSRMRARHARTRASGRRGMHDSAQNFYDYLYS